MRKTLNINLGGMAFVIDENAFELLHNYLEALRKKFVNETEREEILNDIELRIAEMLGQKLDGKKEVVSIEDVQEVIAVMGKPEDIAGEETGSASPADNTASSTTTSTTIGAPVARKLFRDPDDAKIGGVISGLCHYFGINDPVWMRIAAIVLIFMTSGAIVLFYLLLLIVIPKANTAAEKLQMKGEPVNINTIEREIKDAASRAGETIHRVVKDGNFFEKSGHIFISVFRVILKIAAIFCMAIAMILLIIVLIVFIVFFVAGAVPLKQASVLVVDNPHTVALLGYGFLLFFAAPVIAVIYGALKALLGQRSRVTWLKWVLLSGWVLGLVLLIISGLRIAPNFWGYNIEKTQQLALTQPTGGTFYVQLTDSAGNKIKPGEEEINFNIDQDGATINGTNIYEMEKIPVSKPSLELTASDNDSFYMQEIISSNGRSKPDVDKNADMAIYSFSQADSLLNLSQHIYIPNKGKWRNQQIKLSIAIPEGKTIHFDGNIRELGDETSFANTVWTVEGGKVKCIAGNHAGKEESGNNARRHHGKVKVYINKGKERKQNTDDNKSDNDF